jgi:signal transduction histidine kinase/DNA-binding response OmpR family regulator
MNATYTNLDPGRYIFRVKASNNDGVWNKDGISLIIFVTPPFWETWWFRVLLISLSLVFIYMYTYSRIRHSKRQSEILKKLVLKKTDEIVQQFADLERKNTELSRKQAENLEITEKLREADEKKLKFFANISHEFRTPLTLIVGPAENLLKDKSLNSDIQEQINLIYKNGNRLLRLMNDLLDFQKIDNDSMKVRLIHGDIVDFINDVINAFEGHAQRHHVDLNYHPEIDKYTTLFDPGKLEIILFNLISNAIKYTEEGGQIKVLFSEDKETEAVRIVVQDNGIGIDKKKIDNLFDRFYQIEAGPFSKYGTGIGLALTKELTELMDGRIEVRSSSGVGTTFTITLPLYKLEVVSGIEKFILDGNRNMLLEDDRVAQYIVDEGSKNGLHDSGNNRSEKILIVDDNADLRTYIINCLENIYTVIEANNGKEALQVAKKSMPQLIISDIMMPEMDGIEFCRQIKSDILTSHIPVILLTAKTSKESQLSGYHEGADDYLVKPFQTDLLITRIQNLIASRKKLREAFKSKLDIQPHDFAVSSVDEKFLNKALEIIEKNISDPEFGSPELVSALGLSRTFVHLKFKKLTNFSTGEFIKNVRLKRAAQLLKQKKHRISEVGYMVGFDNPKYFSKSFKIQFGSSPAQFVQEHEQEYL